MKLTLWQTKNRGNLRQARQRRRIPIAAFRIPHRRECYALSGDIGGDYV